MDMKGRTKDITAERVLVDRDAIGRQLALFWQGSSFVIRANAFDGEAAHTINASKEESVSNARRPVGRAQREHRTGTSRERNANERR
jgi:hypothetical protein